MGEFNRLVDCFVNILNERFGKDSYSDVKPSDIAKIFNNCNDVMYSKINLYPGNKNGQCRNLVVLVSIRSNKSGHLSFGRLFELMIQHVLGHCQGATKNVLIITDNWDPKIVNKWVSTINNMKDNGVYLEAYFFQKTNKIKMHI